MARFPGLRQGIGIALVAPSGYADDDQAVRRGVAVLEAQGCRVHAYSRHYPRHQRFGASDADRIAQLYAAADDPNVQVVLAVRGGYGLSRLLPLLDLARLADSGKLFVGHSDFTALQLALLGQGVVSLHGPMLCADFGRAPPNVFAMEHFWRCLTQPQCRISGEGANNPQVRIAGKLWGGNLAMITHLVGTPYMPMMEGGILFLEDINEHPYRIERMLLQLLHAGILQRQQAVLLGNFSDYRLSEYDNGYDFAAMLRYVRSVLPLPVLTGLPFGHVAQKVTLPVGASAQLTSANGRFELLVQDYPHLPA